MANPLSWLRADYKVCLKLPPLQDDLMESCKAVADVIPRLVEGVKYSMQNPNSAMAQLNLINNAERFIDPASR
jgi:talin